MVRNEDFDNLSVSNAPESDTDVPRKSEMDAKADAQGGTIGDQTPVESLHTEDLYTDGRVPDIFAVERADEWVAFDDSGEVAADTNGWSVLESAINSCPTGGMIYAKGQASADGTISLSEDKTLYAPDLAVEVTQTTTPAFEIYGSEIGTQSLGSDGNSGDYQISVGDVSNIERGDIIAVQKSVTFVGNDTNIGEGHRVRAVDSGTNTIELEDTLVFDYPTADSAEATHITPESATIEGVSLNASPSESEYDGIVIHSASGASVKDVETDGFGRRGILIRDGYGITITDSTFNRGAESTSGYGVVIGGASANVRISQCRFHECRHATAVVAGPNDNGLPREVVSENNFASAGREAVFDSHGEAISVTVRSNEIHARNQRPAVMGAKYNRFIDNVVYGSVGYSDRGGYDSSTHIIRGNEFRRGEGVRLYSQAGYDLVRITDNEFSDPRSDITVTIESPPERLEVRGNYFGDVSDIDSYQLRVRTSVGSASVSDNYFAPSGRFGVNFDSGGDNIIVSDNEFIESNTNGEFTGGAIGLASVNDSVVKDNHIVRTQASAGKTIRLGSGDTGRNTVRDNTVLGRADLTIDGVTAVYDNEGMANQRNVTPDEREGRKYLDDGTNRADSSAGYRYYDGSSWLDL